MNALVTLLALLIEAMFGYPDWVARRIGHPAAWMGRLIGLLDRSLNREADDPALRRRAGVFAVLILVFAVGVASLVIERCLLLLPLGIVAVAILASTLLAQKSLYAHVARVAFALESGDLQPARAAVSHIVGRETAELDEAGVARAAIESLAENFSDGVVASALWMVIGGLPGAAIYKGINTADSMIGHRDARHRDFGWAAAKLDDLVNLPASRLAALTIVGASTFTPGASVANAWEAVRRDASQHASPNAGYPEAAVAGALGLALGGPRRYGDLHIDGAWMGDGRRDVGAADIRAALLLYARADAILIGIVALIAAVIAIAI
ncbi:MAG: adenosylcobinamide-phosphate synthase CbiB [Methyloceanibacter sp.]